MTRRPMRIAYLHQYFNTPEMPGGTRSYEMGRRLAAAGHEVVMITSDRNPDAQTAGWRVSEVAGMQVHWLRNPYRSEMSYRRRIVSFSRFALSAGRRAAQTRPDLVFASSTPLTIALPGAFCARRLRIPMVFEVRDLWPDMPIAIGALRHPLTQAIARRLERYAYRNAERVVALSADMKRGVVRAGYPAQRVAVIPNSSDLSLFDVGPEPGRKLRASLPWLGDRPMVLYAGALGRINDAAYWVRVAEAAVPLDPDLCIVIVGDGAEREQILDEARERQVLDRNFHLLAPVPKCEIPAWFSAADIVTSVVLDLKEAWANSANKFFDGLAARKPIAINHEGWQADLLREEGAGIVLPVRDPAAAAAMLVERTRDRKWLRAAGGASARVARERFDREALAKRLDGVLRSARESFR